MLLKVSKSWNDFMRSSFSSKIAIWEIWRHQKDILKLCDLYIYHLNFGVDVFQLLPKDHCTSLNLSIRIENSPCWSDFECNSVSNHLDVFWYLPKFQIHRSIWRQDSKLWNPDYFDHSWKSANQIFCQDWIFAKFSRFLIKTVFLVKVLFGLIVTSVVEFCRCE